MPPQAPPLLCLFTLQHGFFDSLRLPFGSLFNLSCQKSLAEFRVRRREINIIRFLPRHVRGRKHFTRSERRIVRYQRTTEAQNAAKLSRKSGKATFSTVSRGFLSEASCHVIATFINTVYGLYLSFTFMPTARRAASASICVGSIVTSSKP